jgi:hypothetical protein
VLLALIPVTGINQWNIDLLVGVMARLVAQRNHLRAKEAKARARTLRKAREYLGDVEER